ncbi:pseudouridine synthase [Nadsonia fulvescens var. elongata DSM 6958]|uniref:21S rRNA pseudouridine(2819) synthase n=1 Tax=Nadsonia fulvescens var. elongata DSM 6958 TaxID=857566 RepID=A0A1E3PHZ0_9ASCO|nr:pseudouridine synthase [Nadsonia fulvescens var. elongata DSM 6958]
MLPRTAPLLPLLHRTKHYVLINKPPGVYSQGPRTPDVISLLKQSNAQWFNQNNHIHPFCEPKLVQRLDSAVSGAMILCTSLTYVTKIARYLSHGGNNGIPIDKRYIALLDTTKSSVLEQINPYSPSPAVSGITWTTPTSGIIDSDLIIKDPDSNLRNAPTKNVRAITKFWLYPQYPKLLEFRPNTMVAVFEPVTGRKHQLRRHAAQILDAPIIGDSLYNNIDNNTEKPFQIALHSFEFGISPNPTVTNAFRAPALWGNEKKDKLWYGVVDENGWFDESVYQLKEKGDLYKEKDKKKNKKQKKQDTTTGEPISDV